MPKFVRARSPSNFAASPANNMSSISVTASSPSIVKRCRDLPGYELFQYVDESGAPVDITSSDVNAYLREISGADFTAKDFRTWAGTVLAARALQEFEKFTSQAEAKKNLLQAVEAVARMLGNTPAICRRCYVHPVVLESYLDGTLVDQLKRQAEQKLATGVRKLPPDEAAVLMLLQQTLSRATSEKGLNARRRGQSCLFTRLAPAARSISTARSASLPAGAHEHKPSAVREGCGICINHVVGQTVVFLKASPERSAESILIALWNQVWFVSSRDYLRSSARHHVQGPTGSILPGS